MFRNFPGGPALPSRNMGSLPLLNGRGKVMVVMMMVKLRMVIMMMGMMTVAGLLADGLQDKLARGPSSVSPVGCTGRNASLSNSGAAPHFCLAYLQAKCEEMLYSPPLSSTCHF